MPDPHQPDEQGINRKGALHQNIDIKVSKYKNIIPIQPGNKQKTDPMQLKIPQKKSGLPKFKYQIPISNWTREKTVKSADMMGFFPYSISDVIYRYINHVSYLHSPHWISYQVSNAKQGWIGENTKGLLGHWSRVVPWYIARLSDSYIFYHGLHYLSNVWF